MGLRGQFFNHYDGAGLALGYFRKGMFTVHNVVGVVVYEHLAVHQAIDKWFHPDGEVIYINLPPVMEPENDEHLSCVVREVREFRQ